MRSKKSASDKLFQKKGSKDKGSSNPAAKEVSFGWMVQYGFDCRNVVVVLAHGLYFV